jgi:hypothetical protein
MAYIVITSIFLADVCFAQEIRDLYRDAGRKGFLK